MSGIIGKKIGMTRVFDGDGRSVVATVIEAGPCYVTQVKTQETDGYSALQLGFEDKKEKKTNKPGMGHFSKAGIKPKRVLKEFRNFPNIGEFQLGDEVKADAFEVGTKVTVSGISKGKGFQGVVKRHGFGGGPKTHGQSDRLRAPGSLGQSSWPSRVFKGIRMPGRMGNDKVTLKKRRVLQVLPERNILLIEGTVPGSKSSVVIIKK